MKYLIGGLLGILTFMWLFSQCSAAGKNKTGHEYMPDMYHSVAYEANVLTDYKWNTWNEKSSFTKAQLSQPKGKVNGTIARGYTAAYYGQDMGYIHGKNAANAISTPTNGEVPFYYANTEDDRLRCEAEMVKNPFKITKAGLEKAKPLYESACGICHGNKGDGQGWLVTMPDSKYPVQPKNLIGDDMVAAGNGRYYFAMMYGKNVMGGYSDKLSFEERWQVLHYIRSLQATSKKLKYDQDGNTLNNIDVPDNAVVIVSTAQIQKTKISPGINIPKTQAANPKPH
jgi:mono/diheme cytochrome c family protein